MRCKFTLPAALGIVLSGAVDSFAAGPDFERDVAPILAKRCLECHNAKDVLGGLNLTTRESLHQGGDSGLVVVAGMPADSTLMSRVADGEMPPESRGQSQKLPAAEIKVLRQWIASGAHWPQGRTLDIYEKTTDVRGGLDWWSLQPIQRPEPPKVDRASRTANPIDAFILRKLEAAGMEPAPPADRRTLIRRATYDLLGLPATPQRIAAFVNDQRPDAYERLIDELLQSKHYGERWGRYWLDLVRYAETCGYERDQMKPNIWRYRDWVIQALNDDMPYDRFVLDQLAGDEVPHRDEQSVIATGMLRAGTWNDEPNDAADYLYTRLEDMVHTTSSAFLALTVKCARCHDHKFDPIRQTDYYRTASFFWAGYMGQANLGGPDKEQLGYDVFGWTDKSSQVEPIRLLIKGERERPGAVVPPGFLSAVKALDQPLTDPPEGSRTTRRRLQLAQWITDKSNPITARVMVNRIWQHHFGEGIVRTPNNFGFKGDHPTHPELLDWLAAEFMHGGWKIKRLHKQIMLSSTYRQASQHPRQTEYAEKDFLNKLWWRFNRRRLDAEALRDSMLAVSGQLNPQMGGPSFYPQMSDEALEGLSRKSKAWSTSAAEQRARRSIYMIVKRSRLLPLMTAFDSPDATLPCGKRDVTTVAPQALALMNNHFVHSQSAALADRLERETNNVDEQVQRAWQLTLGRQPTKSEAEFAAQHLVNQTNHFDNLQEVAKEGDPTDLSVKKKLSLWLRADRDVDVDENGRVKFWNDAAPSDGLFAHDAAQPREEARPLRVAQAINGRPAIRFDGKGQFLQLTGQVLFSQHFTIIAVASQASAGTPNREIISNWHNRDRSTVSVFLGTTGGDKVRLSDAYQPTGKLTDPTRPFILTGVSDTTKADAYQNRKSLASSKPLATRVLHAPYVIGTQGNIRGEWWHGDIAEILVYDRALEKSELERVWQYLARRYQLKLETTEHDPQHLALASLCHVLLNTNEFIYVD